MPTAGNGGKFVFLLEVQRLTTVFARFNSSCSRDRFFSALIASVFSRWLLRGSNGVVLVTRTASLGIMIESSASRADGDGYVKLATGTLSAEG
jgi:hypothetical protein